MCSSGRFLVHLAIFSGIIVNIPTSEKENQMVRNTILLAALLCAFTNITNAQNYYPADIGNTWVLESEDGAERSTYTIETTDERFNGKQLRILDRDYNRSFRYKRSQDKYFPCAGRRRYKTSQNCRRTW